MVRGGGRVCQPLPALAVKRAAGRGLRLAPAGGARGMRRTLRQENISPARGDVSPVKGDLSLLRGTNPFPRRTNPFFRRNNPNIILAVQAGLLPAFSGMGTMTKIPLFTGKGVRPGSSGQAARPWQECSQAGHFYFPTGPGPAFDVRPAACRSGGARPR